MMTQPDPVLPRPFREGQGGLADPMDLSDEAIRYRRLRAAPNWWQRRPMFEVIDGPDDLRGRDGLWVWAKAAARWPEPFPTEDLDTDAEGVAL